MKRFSMLPAWRFVAVGLAVSAAGAFGLIDLASAHTAPDAPTMAAGMHGPGGGGFGLAGFPLGGPMFDRLLDDVQASDAQRDQLQRIVEAARADLKPTAEASRSDHARMVDLFARPLVDAAAIEALRKQMLARHDQMTRRLNVAMLDAAKVLTPEQRQQMAEHIRQREARRAERAMHPDAPDAPTH